jgi:hypothetical protein
VDKHLKFGLSSLKGSLPNQDTAHFGAPVNVRYWPKADICGAVAHVSFGPKADINHFSKWGGMSG